MLISRQKKFIFIHIYKNAGSSIREALISHASPKWQRFITKVLKRLKLPATIIDHQPLPAHVNASEVIKFIGEDEFKKYFSFAIVRNPWDWQVSLYKFMQKTQEHHQHHIINEFKSFEEYIHWRCEEDVQFQKDFIYSNRGELLVNYVGRFERIDEEFNNICNIIGISETLPKINVSNTIPYQTYYNANTKQMIQKTFEPDISLFKYSFE